MARDEDLYDMVFLYSEYVSVELPLSNALQEEILGLAISLPPELINAAPKRREEFLAGRYCAARALINAGLKGPPPVGIAHDRSPIWPPGWVGSITHARGLAAAAVASNEKLLGLGIDSELIMPKKTSEQVFKRILTGPELQRTDPEWVTLVFSAKESIYKCLKPLCGNFFGFEDANIFNVDKGHFNFRLTSDIGGGFKEGMTGEGRYSLEGEWAHTAVELRGPGKETF